MALRSVNAGNYLSLTGLSLSQTATTVCGRASIIGTNSGWQQLAELRGTGGNICEIDYDEGAGQIVAYSGSNNTNVVAAPAAGTWFFWYLKLTGAGANQIEVGIWPDGGSLTTATLTLGNNNTITEIRWGGNPFDDSNYDYAALKVFNSVLSSGQLATERTTYEPWIPAYISLPALSGSVAGCALDQSGNGRNFTVNGSPTISTNPVLSHVMGAGQGSFTLSGQAAGLRRDYTLSAGQASFALSGQDATLTALGNKTLTADAGSFALSGQTATPRATRALAAGLGSYALTGQTASLNISGHVVLTATPATYALTGYAATLTYSSFDGWLPVGATPETWAAAAVTAEAWTPVPSTSETWSAA